MSSHCIYLGLDFSKEKFDFHGADTRGTIVNTPAEHRRFLAKLTPGTHLVCESTGSCHRALVTAAHAAGTSTCGIIASWRSSTHASATPARKISSMRRSCPGI